jgi:hypothetical protein
MAGYLDAYGAEDERRSRLIKTAVLALAAVLVIAASVYLALQDRREKQVVRHFLSEVNAGRYQEAYRTWGCTDAHPCPEYNYQKFLEDWGPEQSRNPWAISAVDGCPTGVVITVDAKGADPQPLWVQRSDKSISFSPWPECQGRRWRFRQFFHRILGS